MSYTSERVNCKIRQESLQIINKKAHRKDLVKDMVLGFGHGGGWYGRTSLQLGRDPALPSPDAKDINFAAGSQPYGTDRYQVRRQFVNETEHSAVGCFAYCSCSTPQISRDILLRCTHLGTCIELVVNVAHRLVST